MCPVQDMSCRAISGKGPQLDQSVPCGRAGPGQGLKPCVSAIHVGGTRSFQKLQAGVSIPFLAAPIVQFCLYEGPRRHVTDSLRTTTLSNLPRSSEGAKLVKSCGVVLIPFD